MTYAINLGAGRGELPGRKRLGKYLIIQKSGEIPLGRSFRFESPEDPAPSGLLVCVQLRLNVTACVVLQRLIPGVNPIDLIARTYTGASRIPAVVAGTDAVPVQGRCAICHGRRPFADNEQVIGIGGIGFREVTSKFDVVLIPD